jgi:predicted RNase H-like HicB family nuclease
MRVPYTTELYEEDHQVVALCRELNVSSFGETPGEALTSLQEAVGLFLEECQSMGSLEAVLEEAGYRPDAASPGSWRHREPIQINRLEAVIA